MFLALNMTDGLTFSDLLLSPEADDELKEAFASFSGGAEKVPEDKLGDILAGMGIKPTKAELDDMVERAGDKGEIDFNGFKKMISTRATTADDEKALMKALTYFAADGKVDTGKMCGALLAFNSPDADAEDMNRLKAQGASIDVQEFYLKLTEV